MKGAAQQCVAVRRPVDRDDAKQQCKAERNPARQKFKDRGCGAEQSDRNGKPAFLRMSNAEVIGAGKERREHEIGKTEREIDAEQP